MPAFHLAFPVNDLSKTRDFYHGLLDCPVGRSSERWIDFDFFGHQITAHLCPENISGVETNGVDGDQVPVRHFGAILEWNDWEALSDKLDKAGKEFIIRPRVRFQGKAGEQGTFFVRDPSGNALEFKTFRDMSQIFATKQAAE